MKIKLLLLLTIILADFHQQNVQAQTKYEIQKAAGKVIDAELKSLYGAAYSAPVVYAFDSLLISNRNPYFFNPVEDPYGTLKGCFIFIGGPDRFHRNIVGIYKDGHVLWHSDTLKCYPELDLFTTRDLNNDGTVDLVFAAGLEEGQLWIFSWDGQIGSRINAVDEDGESVIEADVQQHYFSFVDVEGDGVWEIQNNWAKDGSTSWSWNGQEYGHWSNTPNTFIAFPPRNKIDITVACRVINQLDTLVFNYQIFNKPTSKQRVEDFRVWCKSQNVIEVSSPSYWGFSGRSGRGYGWDSWISYTTGQIRVGKSMSGFTVKAKALCGINDFDSHGYNSVGSRDTIPNSLDKLKMIVKDQNENAFQGKTIGPCDPPNPFIPIDFIDTILSYKHQSLALGWLKEPRVEKRLDRKLDRAKQLLQMAITWPPKPLKTDHLDEALRGFKEDEEECSEEYGRDILREIPQGALEEDKLKECTRVEQELGYKRPEGKMEKLTESQWKELYQETFFWMARKVLESFVREIEILNRISERGASTMMGKKQYITSEAYSLLKYNALYVIDQLPEKKK